MTMVLSEEDARKIAKQLAAHLQGKCLCGLTINQHEEMGHLFGAFKDEGEGDIGKGVEIIRRVMSRQKHAEAMSQSIAKNIRRIIVTATASGIGWLLWQGFRKFILIIKTGGA